MFSRSFHTATEQIEMGVPVEIEVGQVSDRFVGTARGDFTGPYQTSEALSDLDVDEVRRMQFVVVAKEPGLDWRAKRGLQEKLQQRRRVDHDHAESRSWRITTAAGVFSPTRFRLCDPGQHVVARRTRR